MNTKLVWPIIVTVLGLGALALGAFIYVDSTERAKSEKTAAEQILKKQEQDTEAKKLSDGIVLQRCLDNAQAQYTSYLKLNSINTRKDANGQDTYQMYQENWDYADRKLNSDRDDCYKRYPGVTPQNDPLGFGGFGAN